MRKLVKFMGIFTSLFIPILSAFVFTKLWLWFIVPIISVQPLSIPAALGITILVNFFRNFDKKAIEKMINEDKVNFWDRFSAKKITLRIMVPLIVLFAGWVVTLFL